LDEERPGCVARDRGHEARPYDVDAVGSVAPGESIDVIAIEPHRLLCIRVPNDAAAIHLRAHAKVPYSYAIDEDMARVAVPQDALGVTTVGLIHRSIDVAVFDDCPLAEDDHPWRVPGGDGVAATHEPDPVEGEILDSEPRGVVFESAEDFGRDLDEGQRRPI